MLKRFRIILLASVLAFTPPAPAEAAPIGAAFAAISTFAASSALAGVLVNVGLAVVTQLGLSLIQNLLPKPSKPAASLAMRLSVAVGGVLAQAFIMGDYATAGSMAYRGSYGSDAGTPNAFYVEKRVLSDVPMPTLTGFMFGEVRATILWDQEAEQGFPIAEARVGGVDHMWIRYHDGTQTAADPYLLARFGSHPSRPYTANMVGIGQAEAIVTRLVPPADNRDLFPANLEYIFETSGIRQYDIAKDSTAGGFGSHRRDDPATWEPSNLLPVMIYNVLNGVYFGDEWLFGLQNTHPSRLPASAWIAGINEAARRIDLVGGGTEAQFTGGVEISVDTPPVAVIENLLTGCSGRLAEIGGIYKPQIGAPGAAVFSYSDKSIVVTRPQDYEPFPQIEATYNGIRAKYREKAKGWQLADAPAYYSPELEIEDGGRYAADVTFETVSSNTQVQRLIQTAAEAQRRWRKHQEVLPPIASELEPLDVVAKTSEHNGYIDKKFVITSMDDEPTFLQLVSLEEIDPDDYDWVPGIHEKPRPVVELPRDRPEPQVIIAWGVEGTSIPDDAGRPRRPAVKFTWDPGVQDVRAVGFEVRTRIGAPIDRVLVLSDSTDDVIAGQAILASSRLMANQQLEGRGIYYARSTRRTDWTGWLPFNTPDLRMSMYDLDDAMWRQTGMIDGPGSLLEKLDQLKLAIEEAAAAGADTAIEGYLQREELKAETGNARAYFLNQVQVLVSADQALSQEITILSAEFDDNVAFVGERLTALATADSAMAEAITQVGIEVGDVSANGLFGVTASAGPAGWELQFAIALQASVAGTKFQTGTVWLLNSGGTSAIANKADEWLLYNEVGGVLVQLVSFVGTEAYFQNVRVHGNLTVDGTITTSKVATNAITYADIMRSDGYVDHTIGDTEGEYMSWYIDPGGPDDVIVHLTSNIFSSGIGPDEGLFRLRFNGTLVAEMTVKTDDEPRNWWGLVAIGNGAGTWTMGLVGSAGKGGNFTHSNRVMEYFVRRR